MGKQEEYQQLSHEELNARSRARSCRSAPRCR
jgi:hypothetical protein